MALATLLAIWSLEICTLRLKAKSFEDIGIQYFGYRMGIFVQLNVIILLFFAMTTYFILIADFMEPLLKTYRWIIILSAILVVSFPSMLRNLYALRYSSIVAFFFFLFLLGVWISKFTQSSTPHNLKLSLKVGSNLLKAFYIQGMAFCCQFNVVTVTNELRNPTNSRYMAIKLGCVFTIFCLYMLFGIFG